MENEQADIIPAESPQTEILDITNEGDPDVMLNILEKRAALAPRFKEAQNTILATQTYPDDWKGFGDTMCLSSAGAERVGRLFDIQYFDITDKREDFTDSVGTGYRWTTSVYIRMGNRVGHGKGVYSTREPFLGKTGDGFRPVESINENNIQMAAYHRACGNAVKALFGLRGIPKIEWEKIMKTTGQKPASKTNVQHGSGTKGGTSKDDGDKQREFGELLMEIANAGLVIAADEKCHPSIQLGEFEANQLVLAKLSCEAITSFIGKKGEVVKGLSSAKIVKGQRLSIALSKAKKVWAEYSDQNKE